MEIAVAPTIPAPSASSPPSPPSARERRARESETVELRRRDADPFAPLVAESAPMLAAMDLARRLSRTDLPALVEGEAGTGKELLAECIHAASARALGPFVAVDARSVDPALLGVVLCGDERRAGALERAHGGTLYVGSIDALDRASQGALVRAVERGVVARAGEATWREIDVRIVASSRSSLEPLVARGGIGEDLYFRFAAAKIDVPRLRDREGDVALLARHLFQLHAANVAGMTSVDAATLAEDFLSRRVGYAWPGNVRELDGAVTAALALGEDAPIVSAAPEGGAHESAASAGDDIIRRTIDRGLRFGDARAHVLEAFERAYVEAALVRSGGNITRAAAMAGVARRSFQTIRARRRT